MLIPNYASQDASQKPPHPENEISERGGLMFYNFSQLACYVACYDLVRFLVLTC